MVEYLALPAWKAPPTTVDAWVVSLSETGGPVIVSRESASVTWLEIAPLRLRGYVVVENGLATAINFELHALDTEPATRAILASAEALDWELHADDDDEPDDDDDED
ncbi:hypothetical protein P12x_004335 [Tundrisphaera lichenicola]|uniref:hypothetical protein n=1 Tax=Tundrisphaera lichenicola TaxID=2029860 RepID=UPI003EBA6A3D